jgi:hypothetical protein
MPCSASPEDDFERNGGVGSDICGDAIISGLGRAERGVVDELRDFVLVGKSLSPMEFALGNFLSWVSSSFLKTNARRFTSFARLLPFLLLPWCCCGSLDGLPRDLCTADAL